MLENTVIEKNIPLAVFVQFLLIFQIGRVMSRRESVINNSNVFCPVNKMQRKSFISTTTLACVVVVILRLLGLLLRFGAPTNEAIFYFVFVIRIMLVCLQVYG